MKVNRLETYLFAALCTFALPGNSIGGPIAEFQYIGVVSTVFDSGSQLGGTVFPGLAVIGSFSYDLSAADSNSSSDTGSYGDPSLMGAFSLSVLDGFGPVQNEVFQYSVDGFDVVVIDGIGATPDQLIFESGNGISSPSISELELIAVWTGLPFISGGLSSDALPSTAADFTSFIGNMPLLITDQDAVGSVSIGVDVFAVIGGVPEPHGLILASFVALTGTCGRKRSVTRLEHAESRID